MPQFLYTVTEVFEISGRFLITVPGIPPELVSIRTGTPLHLRRPDGTVLPSYVHSVMMVSPHDPKRPVPVALPPSLAKQDVPAGTEVWLAESSRDFSV